MIPFITVTYRSPAPAGFRFIVGEMLIGGGAVGGLDTQVITAYMSNRDESDGSFMWKADIDQVPSIKMKAGNNFKGYVKPQVSTITFLQGAFRDSSNDPIIPPDVIDIKIETGETEATKSTIIECSGVEPSDNDKDGKISYKIKEKNFDFLALSEGIDDQDTKQILNITPLSSGEATIQTATQHGFDAGDEIIMQAQDQGSTFAYTGKYTITKLIDLDEFNIQSADKGVYDFAGNPGELSRNIIPLPMSIGSTNHQRMIKTGQPSDRRYYQMNTLTSAAIGTGVVIYDEGANISTSGGVWSFDSNKRYLERTLTNLFGEATVDNLAPTKPNDSLDLMLSVQDFCEYVASILGLTLDYQPSIIGKVAYIVETQRSLLSILDDIAGFNNFRFTILDGTLRVTDASENGTSRTVRPLKISYQPFQKIKTIESEWNRRFTTEFFFKDEVGDNGFRVKEFFTTKSTNSFEQIGDIALMTNFAKDGLTADFDLLSARANQLRWIEELNKRPVEIESLIDESILIGDSFDIVDERSVPNRRVQGRVNALEYIYGKNPIMKIHSKASVTKAI
jgi:hypothetical protein